MTGRPNLFQASMLRWRDLYPYNAVHVVRIGTPLAVADLQRAIDDVLTRYGLAGLDLDAGHQRFGYAGGPAHEPVSILAPGPDRAETVRAEIERQLNNPFAPSGRIDAFRFFAVPGDGGFDLGLAYDHFIAAGDSIVLLLKAISDRYGGAPVPAATPPLSAPTYRLLFLRHLLPLVIGFRRIPGNVAGLRHAFRPRYPHGDAPGMGFAHVRVGRAAAAALRRTAKGWGVTQNDVLLAMLLQMLSPQTEARRAQRRRNEIAVASIVNIRRDCGPAARDAFGQFLSSFLVSHKVPPGVTLEALARDVGRFTARVKREKLWLQTLLAMGVAGFVWRFLSPERRAGFHGKAYPVWAGLSPFHVDVLWGEAGGADPAPEYVRAVPTGPMAPLVFAVTTAAGMLEIGISYRRAAFTRAEVDRMAASLLDRVERLC